MLSGGSPAHSRDSHAACVETFRPVTLTGIIRREIKFGPPGFGDYPRTDRRLSVPILHLDEQISICPGADDDIDDSPVGQVDQVQLIYVNSATVPRAAGRVNVVGILQRATNAFHVTPVTLIVGSRVANSTASTAYQNPNRAADRSRPPPPSIDDEDRVPANPATPRRDPNPPSDQAAQPQVERLGLTLGAPPPR
jgi:hypothetical protein